MSDLRIGYAERVITPEPDQPVYLAGFDQNRRATAIHDGLYARALAIATDQRSLVLLALDLIGLGREHALVIRRAVRDETDVLVTVACTHTHHGPDTIGLWGPDRQTSGANAEYLQRLVSTAAEACVMARRTMVQASLRAACTHVQVVRNARDPQIVDDELTCLQLVSPDGAPLATLLIYACHPEVLWRDNTEITSDYPHFVREKMEEQTGAPCLFFAGALGGMLTPQVPEHTFAAAQAMGQALSRAALEALSQAQTEEIHDITHVSNEFSIPLQNPLLEMAMRADLLSGWKLVDGLLLTEVSLTTIGPAALLGVPGELLPRLGLTLKAEMRNIWRVPAIVGLANDELGYILPAEDYLYPEDPFSPGEHYEETMLVGSEAGPRLMQAARRLISR